MSNEIDFDYVSMPELHEIWIDLTAHPNIRWGALLEAAAELFEPERISLEEEDGSWWAILQLGRKDKG